MMSETTAQGGYFQPPEAEDKSPKAAISALLVDIAVNVSEVVTTHALNPTDIGRVEYNFMQAIKSMRCLIALTQHFIRKEDKEKMTEIKTIVYTDPKTLMQAEVLDAAVDELTQILKNSGLYELGKPSKVREINEDLLIPEENQ